MNEFKDYLGTFLLIVLYISAATMALAIPISVGYCLYLWGSIGIMLAPAAWAAFILWLNIIGVGFLVFLLSLAAIYFL